MLRLTGATPTPPVNLVSWAGRNGRTRGLKLRVVDDPAADQPRWIAITPSTINDVLVGEQVLPETGATYVVDKGYCNYSWWTRIHATGSFFVTRPNSNVKLQVVLRREVEAAQGEGFTVLRDAEVKLETEVHAKPAIPLRRVRIKREAGGVLTFLRTIYSARRWRSQ